MKNTFIIKLLIVAWVILFSVTSHCMAATYYVAANDNYANDSHPGTLEAPWATISKAADVMVAGDTVYIRQGVYHEQVLTQRSGNATQGYIVFANYPNETPVIDGTGVTTGSNGIVVTHSYIKFIGLEIRNWNDNAIWTEKAGHLEISDCDIHDVTYGIGLADGTHDFVLNRVVAHHFDLYGFDASPSGGEDNYNGTFNDCIAHTGRDPAQNVDGFALGHGTQHSFSLNRCTAYNVFDGFDISARNTTLNRCLAYNCGNGGYKLWQDAIKLENCIGYNNEVSNVELDWDGEAGTTTIQNCTFVDGKTYNIWVENAADTLHMFNCILAGGDNIGLAFEQRNISNYQGDYNIFHTGNADRAVIAGYEDEFSLTQIESGAWSAHSGQDDHSLTVSSTSALFTDPANYVLTLPAASIAIDAGTNASAPATDYAGNSRPYGSGYDIGAYEYRPYVSQRYAVNGTVTHNGSPVCAMVLANGQYMFSCKEGEDFGKYELNVPLDSNGDITVQAFVSGLAPFRMTTTPSSSPFDIDMQPTSPESRSPEVTTQIESDLATPEDWVRIAGTVTLGGTPLCAMVLANGQYMFSCNANNGVYDLTVPLDPNGKITLFVFVSGLQPYRLTFTP